jgi:pimeloyl-ACP methyl ester carboxylesterase
MRRLLLNNARVSRAALAVQNPLSSLADDVTAVHRVVDVQQGPVLMAGHSWGGAVITEAGNDPKNGLVYVAAGTPDGGRSFDEWWKPIRRPRGGRDQAIWRRLRGVDSAGVRQYFVQDIPSDEANVVYATEGPLAVRCFGDKISAAAWRSKPSWYIVAAHDETIPRAQSADWPAL